MAELVINDKGGNKKVPAFAVETYHTSLIFKIRTVNLVNKSKATVPLIPNRWIFIDFDIFFKKVYTLKI